MGTHRTVKEENGIKADGDHLLGESVGRSVADVTLENFFCHEKPEDIQGMRHLAAQRSGTLIENVPTFAATNLSTSCSLTGNLSHLLHGNGKSGYNKGYGKSNDSKGYGKDSYESGGKGYDNSSNQGGLLARQMYAMREQVQAMQQKEAEERGAEKIRVASRHEVSSFLGVDGAKPNKQKRWSTR